MQNSWNLKDAQLPLDLKQQNTEGCLFLCLEKVQKVSEPQKLRVAELLHHEMGICVRGEMQHSFLVHISFPPGNHHGCTHPHGLESGEKATQNDDLTRDSEADFRPEHDPVENH